MGKVFLDSTRAGGATVVAAYSPRIRPGVPVSFPVAWENLDRVAPADFTVRTAVAQLSDADPWIEHMPEGQRLERRSDRRGPHDPDRPRTSHA